jgi:hypothetical protein
MARGTRGSGAKSGSNFLSNFFRKKRETNVEPAYKPEPGVMYGQLPADYKQTEAEQFRKSRAFQIANTGRTDTSIDVDKMYGTPADGLLFDPTLAEKEQTYGPGRRASDLLERYVGQQVDQSQLLGYTQALTNQDIAAMSETNRQRLETNLAFDRDSPTRMQERQLTAKKGEALLAEAVAKQATSAAQIGGLGTARTYGSGRVN